MSESEKKARAQKEEEDRKAFLVMQEYYSCLLIHNYERAYELLSELDKQYITMKTFTEWRDFINRQLIMREFTIKCSESVQSQNLREGLNSPVKKHYIDTVVKNLLNQATENQYAAKYTVQENGSWRILLGYRDLGDIAAFFNRLSLDREKSEMEKHWEQYCEDNCRRLDILSLNGLLKEAESEIYRYRRYKQALTLACFALKHQEDVSSEKSLSDILEAASKTINDSVREVDIPAYIGNGMFAILYVEMKKRQANSAVKRLRERLIKSILQETNHKVDIETMILQYTGGAVKAYIDSFCEKFLK